jgi:hypothetical protein
MNDERITGLANALQHNTVRYFFSDVSC